MSLTITGATGIQLKLNKLVLGFVESDKKLVKIVSEARNRMRKRTNDGKTASGGASPELNEKYQAYKISKGKRGFRDLHFTGNTLNNMDVKRIPRGAMIYFGSEESRKIAHAHNFGRKQKRFSFFRLGKDNEQYIFNEWRKPIKKALR